MSSKTLVIAEAGVNHNGDLNLAFKLIDAAAAAGADFVKFQTFSAKRQVTRTAAMADYQKIALNESSSQYEMLSKLELTAPMHSALIAHCKLRGIGFLSTAFDIESIDLLVELGQTIFKIPSGEITNLPYLRHIGQLRCPVILSTGMATLTEIEAAIQALEQSGSSRAKITVLHCTTEYPTPMSEVNLLALQTIGDYFNMSVGYSDHTLGIEIPIAAVARGAVIIEKHFTLDRKLPGPDHQASLEPTELKSMVDAIRNIEIALGNGVKAPTLGEQKNKVVARKSIVANCRIKRGEMFTSLNITTKRPGTGISPMLWDEIVGTYAKRDYEPDDFISP